VYKVVGLYFYQKTCLYGTFPECGGLELLRKCICVNDEYELGRKEVELQRSKYVMYDIEG